MYIRTKPIPGSNGYHASYGGFIYSTKKGKMTKLSLSTDKTGYLSCSVNGKTSRVHIMVAKTWR